MKASLEPAIRPAAAADAEHIRRLAAQLGYPASAAEIARRLADLTRNGEHAVFVAEFGTAVVGWIHVLVYHSLLADTPAEIAGLVVDEDRRSGGVGRVLMLRAEHWARDQGCPSIRLRSNVIRERAHAFYNGLGYRVTKSQKVFWKELAA